MSEPEPRPDRSRPADRDKVDPLSTGRALGLGFELIASTAGMALLGWALDEYFDTGPLLVSIFSFLGVVGGVYNVIRDVMKLTPPSRKPAQRKQPTDKP